MTTTAVVDELKASGFANALAVVLSPEESEELTRLAIGLEPLEGTLLALRSCGRRSRCCDR